MDVMGALLPDGAVADLLVLLLEEFEDSWTVMTTVALRPQRYSVIMWFISRKLREPRLSEMPEGMCSMHGTVGSGCDGLAAGSTNQESVVLFRNVV